MGPHFPLTTKQKQRGISATYVPKGGKKLQNCLDLGLEVAGKGSYNYILQNIDHTVIGCNTRLILG